MPNVFAAFTAEVYRTLVTQIIPGLVAIGTWLIVLYRWSPDYRFFAERHSPETFVCVTLAAMFVGQICEDLGSRIEVLYYDRKYPKGSVEREKRDQEWSAYLRTAFVAEPVGQKYIKGVVLRLKFECNSTPGLLIGAVGLVFVPGVSRYLTTSIAVGMIAFALYLLWEIGETVELLADVHQDLLKQIRIVG